MLLRHTGVRREEAVEVAQDDLGFTQVVDGAKVPSLHIAPAKTDTARTVALHREAIEALVALVNSHRQIYGEVPIATRKDHYEATILPPRRYLFQNEHDGAFTVPDVHSLAEQISAFVDDYNSFAETAGRSKIQYCDPTTSDASSPPTSSIATCRSSRVRQLLGHTNIATTAI